MRKLVVSGSGQSVASDKDAADALALGHPKSSGNVPMAWGQRNRNGECDNYDDNYDENDDGNDDGNDDNCDDNYDARSPTFNKGKKL